MLDLIFHALAGNLEAFKQPVRQRGASLWFVSSGRILIHKVIMEQRGGLDEFYCNGSRNSGFKDSTQAIGHKAHKAASDHFAANQGGFKGDTIVQGDTADQTGQMRLESSAQLWPHPFHVIIKAGKHRESASLLLAFALESMAPNSMDGVYGHPPAARLQSEQCGLQPAGFVHRG
jgi:hypothetical protein